MAPKDPRANIRPIIIPVLLFGDIVNARFVIIGETNPTNKLGRKKRHIAVNNIKLKILNFVSVKLAKLSINKSIKRLEIDAKNKAAAMITN